ncbi:MAG: SDR family NAD(P)-dependent oxidoreductase [Pseudomonadota bacterium]
MVTLSSFPAGFRAVVVGASGGIGAAVLALLHEAPGCAEAIGLSRSSSPDLDLEREDTIAEAARQIAAGGPVHLIFDATGVLHSPALKPEKALSAFDPAAAAKAFAVNATGPLLVLKHFHTLMARNERSVFASISARVGSISDNQLGGWYSYRASKAALNMLLKTAAIEIARKRPEALCLALHPGTVDTRLSKPFASGRDLFTPQESAAKLLAVIDNAEPGRSGRFLAYDGQEISW